MYRRLRGENTTVDSPHTYTGAGGLVIRDDHLLVVKEHHNPFWKLPGGYVNPGKDFVLLLSFFPAVSTFLHIH